MTEVRHADRRTAVLTPSSLACLRQVATVNLTAGCAHGCLYCYTRGYSNYPGDGRVTFYGNTLTLLQKELHGKRAQPPAVYFSPSSDPFQPVPEVLGLCYQVFELLLRSGIRVAFLTKGSIPSAHMGLLAEHPDLVSAQIGLISTDEPTLQFFEPHAAPAQVRLQQMGELCGLGIATAVRLDPILPGITDDAENLRRLFQAAAKQGVRSAAASVLFLRPVVLSTLRRRLPTGDLRDRLMAAFAVPQRMRIRAGSSWATALPADARRVILDRAKSIATEYGITVKICACKNPDLDSSDCGIAGHWPTPGTSTQQRTLFDSAGGRGSSREAD